MHNLLIVDDETMLVNSLYEYINRHHAAEYECLKATSAKQALEIAEHIRVDIAVLDIEMPGMDGLELSGHIRQMYPYCHIIFLFYLPPTAITLQRDYSSLFLKLPRATVSTSSVMPDSIATSRATSPMPTPITISLRIASM